MMQDARQWNEANRVISIGEGHTICPIGLFEVGEHAEAAMMEKK